MFAVNQTNAASRQQLTELGNVQPAGSPGASSQAANETGSSSTPATQSHESSLHRLLNRTAEALTSPFSSLTSASHSEWVVRGVGTLLALLLYGVAFRFLARALRMRLSPSPSGAQ